MNYDEDIDYDDDYDDGEDNGEDEEKAIIISHSHKPKS